MIRNMKDSWKRRVTNGVAAGLRFGLWASIYDQEYCNRGPAQHSTPHVVWYSLQMMEVPHFFGPIRASI